MLEHLSPREFEEYCQVLFMTHFNCVVELTAQSGDEGRDLIIHHSSGVIVVECKHYISSTVGRPIVQKLHSAVITKHSTRGMIVTTGRFSPEAEKYAKSLNDVTIELWDAAKLAYLISITFTNSPINSKLAAGIRTTPDSEFPSAFAKSIFSPPRYFRGKNASTAVHVERTTLYPCFYIAEYIAAGSTKTAAGTYSSDWSGTVWIRGDGSKAGFGFPGDLVDELPPPVPLNEVFRTVPGEVECPSLQPYQATAEMKDYIIENCRDQVRYRGQNNVGYSRTILPASGSVIIRSLVLYYIPRQSFVLRIGGASHKGSVDELESPVHYSIRCSTLSTCSVCGTATTAKRQVLCAVCYRPAHRWSPFFPDSMKCTQCKAFVCRNHAVRDRSRVCCVRCSPTGHSLRPRWLPFFVMACLASIAIALLARTLFVAHPPLGILLVVAAWGPFGFLVLQPVIFAKSCALFYKRL